MGLKFCSLSSGSSGNCYLIGSDNTFILIDAGISAKKITDSLSSIGLGLPDLSGILITHEHSDHIKGLDVLSKKSSIPVFANSETRSAIGDLCKNSDLMDFRDFSCEEAFEIGDILVRAFPVSHDAANTVGFSLKNGASTICTATDTGFVTPDMQKALYGADLVVIEANHDENILKMGKYPWFLKQRILSENGHLSNEAAGEAIARTMLDSPKKRRFLLAHLSKENNFPEMAYQTIVNILEKRNLRLGENLKIELLKRDSLSKIYVID